jgi:ATP-dependent Clp protease adaptor protein ClpS
MSPRRTARETKTTTGTGTGYAARTLLFNDDLHTFEEVANQLVKATRCTFARGLALANAVHHLGSAIVYEGHLERCEAVAMVLEEIKLKTRVER